MGSRYYDSVSGGEEIRPGKISSDLRKALNIAENDLPIWIYRMRALGYPPGWLKKAVVDTNDIFDTDSPSKSGIDVQYDYSKLIEYPGFNSPIPEGCNDYHYFVNMPSMLPHQQLDYAKQHMNLFKPAQLPKRAIIDYRADEEPDASTSKDINEEISDESDNENEADPDKNKLEESQTSVKTDPIGHHQILPSTIDTSIDSSAQIKPEPKVSPIIDKKDEKIKLVSKGSPMPRPSPRVSLDKFSEGVVGDLLYFENLPNSKGSFDSIRSLLNTIRKT